MIAEKEIKKLLKDRYVNPIEEISNKIYNNKKQIEEVLKKSKKSTTKEEALLYFRRAMEILIKTPLILSVTALSTNKYIIVRKENFLQLVDDRYYTPIKLISFLDVFKIETNNYKNLSGIIKEPHIGLVINYILEHYTNTFSRFMNRNMEYFYIYEFFYKNGKEIKEILNYLNAYHYSCDKNDKDLYNISLKEVKTKILHIQQQVELLLEKI